MVGGAGSYRSQFQDMTTQKSITTGVDGSANPLITVKDAYHTIYVQRITVSVTTANAGTYTFRDSADTPVLVFGVPTNAAVGDHHVDFGDKGYGLTEGKDLDLAMSGAGPGAVVVVEAYQKRTAIAVP